MRENISLLSTNIIRFGLVLIAFLIPVFFLTTTSEFYNFNKTTLLIVAAFFLFFVWGAKMVSDREVRITRTPLDVPLLLFLAVYILATLFSIDPVVSVLGWHPVFFGSLPSIAALIILYFLATSNLDSTYRRITIIAFIASASLLAFTSIAYFFGQTFIGAPWAENRSWTPAGNLNILVSFLAIMIPVTLSYALFVKESISKYSLYVLVAIQIIAFALINSLFAYVALAAGILFVLLFIPKLSFKTEERITLGVLLAIMVLFAVLMNIRPIGEAVLTPLISGDDNSITLNKPVRLPLQGAWQTSAQALANRPIFGSGPSTYGLVYPSFKPISLNQVNEGNLWNIRFDQPNSAVLTIMTTAGAVGLLIFLLVAVLLIRSLVKVSSSREMVQEQTWFLFLQAGVISALVSFIFFEISVVTGVAFILFAALIFSTLRDWGSKYAEEMNLQLVALQSGALRAVDPNARNSSSDSLAWAFFMPAILLFAAILFYSWATYAGEFYYQKAIVASQENQGSETRDNLVAALGRNPYRDTYHRALVVTDLALARALNQQGELNEEQQQTLLNLIREAIDQGRIATGYEGRGLGSFQVTKRPGSAPLNVANWESLGTVYSNIGGQLRNDSAVHAINTLSQAIRLDPTNPRLYEALGTVYFNLGDTDNAIKNFELATSVKFDYASAHYNLAQAVKRKDDNPARVVNELTATLQLLEDSEENRVNRERVEQELQEAREKLQQQQATQSAAPAQ